MSHKILLIETEPARARSLIEALTEAGFAQVEHVDASVDLVACVRRLAPDLVVVDMALPDRDALKSIRELSASAPRPIVMFADENDPALVEEAIAAGVCSYNLSGVSHQQMKAIVTSAAALFRRYNQVENQLAAARAQLDERRVVERAKAQLMSKRNMTETQAYRWLRTAAMKESRKIAEVAADLIRAEADLIHGGE